MRPLCHICSALNALNFCWPASPKASWAALLLHAEMYRSWSALSIRSIFWGGCRFLYYWNVLLRFCLVNLRKHCSGLWQCQLSLWEPAKPVSDIHGHGHNTVEMATLKLRVEQAGLKWHVAPAFSSEFSTWMWLIVCCFLDNCIHLLQKEDCLLLIVIFARKLCLHAILHDHA